MVRETEALNEIKSKLADVHADVRAKLEEVRGELSVDGQRALDEVSEALRSFDAEIGDADGSDTPAAPQEPGSGEESQPGPDSPVATA